VTSRLLVRVVGIVVTAAAVFLVACGGHEGSGVSSPDTGGTATPAESTPSAVATPLVVPTIAPDIPLTEYRSPDKPYVIGYPQGWEVLPTNVTDSFLWRLGSRPVLQLAVSCYRGSDWTPEKLIEQDAAAISALVHVDPARATPIEVGGLAGKQLRYSVRIEQLLIEHVVVYAVKGECGWRVGLNTFAVPLAPYLPLFQRIIASFQPS